jgi:predicted aspartyl protease
LLVVSVQVIGFELEFMVDTGASFCTLHRDIAQRLALELDPKRTASIVTASKSRYPVFAPVTKVATFRMGSILMENLPIILLDLPDELGVAGLVGMNFLRNFRMCIEPDTAMLVLRKLQKKKSTAKTGRAKKFLSFPNPVRFL